MQKGDCRDCMSFIGNLSSVSRLLYNILIEFYLYTKVGRFPVLALVADKSFCLRQSFIATEGDS